MNTSQINPASWLKLNHSQLLLVHGPDASKFLQGQVTCDLRDLNNPITRLGAQCNPKGRILLTFRALQINPETIALRIPAAMLEKAKQSFGKYIVFSKAKLIDAQQEYFLYGLYGDQAAETAHKIFQALPNEDGGYVENGGNFLIQLDAHRYELWIHNTNAIEFEQQIAASATPGNINDWGLLDIHAGVADICPETYEKLTPQEINYQLVNGINFRKGCYTGQEIVARMHYRGKLKRHMYRFSIITDQNPTPGTAVINNTTGQNAGQIIVVVRANSQEIEILASVLDEQLEGLAIEGIPQKLKQLPLPYAIPTADEKTE